MEESKNRARTIALAMANQGFPQGSVSVGTASRDIMQPLEIERNKVDYYSQPPEKLSTATLRRLCDELYLSMTPEQLDQRYWFINESGDFPKEISSPDRGPAGLGRGFPTRLGREFYIFFGRGDEQTGRVDERTKPTNMFDNVLRQQMDYVNPEWYPEWAERNERKFFENVFKALRRPVGGKKRKTKRTNRTNKRKTKTNKRKKRKSRR
jgi:hypothetical protein